MKLIQNTNLLTEEIKAILFADITEFRETFMLPVAKPENFGDKSDSLHTSLWVEELVELADAKSLVDIADSVVDQIYVLVGRVCELGYWIPEVEYIVSCLLKVAEIKQFDFIACWKEVHSSNMSKLAKNDKELKENIDFYADKGVELNPIYTEMGYVLKCAKDCIYKGSPVKEGKIMKSIFYRDADLQTILA
ncbi:nucleoside triphosphate pyrophosphohydrolase family protein [Vibrio coralliirubri]|uniref:nucleoside triphosphate pyrophosphohydrolase family protein n=1 Tax=Vibrio coralliirubri TaxID=1516159 RepID=UPI002284ECA3|nr:nucleoside triphosphate pyrophosphohydrolase family protein [Vibrio coralliirubri]MCY9861066.1 nucleoside triphosphate pyrophosphohydrolase family protein [Vibrio coralliirubri]